MKYELPNKAAGYFPEVLSLLRALDDNQVYGHERNLSHPADIFLLTFGDVIDCIHRLSKSVNDATLHASLGGSMVDAQLREVRHQVFDLLFYSGNFLEGCLSIIKSLFPDDDKRATKASRDFRDNVAGYISHASQMINKIKHQHRRHRMFTFSWDRNIIVGYYLEGIIDKGVLGPDQELHKPFHGLRTGFSLNREIPYQLFNLYYASACLASIVKGHTKVSTVEDKIIENPRLNEAFEEALKVPSLLLPDEMVKDNPTIASKGNGRYILESPNKKEALNRDPHVAQVMLEARIGIYDRGVAPPYMMQTASS